MAAVESNAGTASNPGTASRPWLENYQPGVPADIDLPADSLPEMLAASARRFGRRTALDFFGAATSYRELGDQVQRAAEGLRRLGVGPGHRVALVLPNCPQHVVAFYAVLRLGAVVVEHNPLYTERELRHQFEDHGATVAIVWNNVVEKIQGFPRDIAVDTIVSVDIVRAMPRTKRLALRLPVPKARSARKALTAVVRDTMPWEKLLRNKPLRRGYPQPGVEDLAAIQYTSGTTGHPKGAMLTHLNLRANAEQGRAWMHGAREGKEVMYAVLPMFHAFGMTLHLTFGILTGSRIVLFPKFDVDLVLAAAKKHPPTIFCAVPPIYERTAREARKRGVDISSVRFAISGAMNLAQETVDLWESTAGGLLVEGYGMTEASPVALGNPFAETRRNGSIGVPFPSTEMRVVDPEHPANDVEPGQPGELLIRGPQVFRGYWGKPEETAATLLDGGWLRTGDIVTVGTDHNATIVDRKKELIITGGFNVSPSEVEDALRSHPDVVEAAAVGLPRAAGGEDVTAAVVLRPQATIDESALREYCRGRLAAYKVPRRIVPVDELPKSMLGKVLRKKVREQLAR
ncbi:long-chain-fatty-acid--CoA ligase [Arthrobacter mangrovi]|uniref:Long-chain-fatty-acid--CoA ligase n=1 Tax=Arthrobacter mangrovi TaxID=2966350 RepID=A0ABQ5MRA7_9MICC|nr:long-chain-fatty-acid--CoA ligase [Arthrobacter mangrovi]GLB66510.1 long-chain-fatty-acid--CoA ligase [Arthrobacter mangrovi]